MHFLCSQLSLHNLCCLNVFQWYFLHIFLHFDFFVFIYFQCLSYTANRCPEHITTSKWAGTGKLANSPFLRCSALLLPRIVINFSSSVPNFSSPAAYKSCNGRPHTDVHTLSLTHTHTATSCWHDLLKHMLRNDSLALCQINNVFSPSLLL